jgi:hypothetical protein
LKCEQCECEFEKEQKEHTRQTNKNKKYIFFCSEKCNHLNKTHRVETKCGNCNSPLTVQRKILKNSKSGFAFCNRSCSATYNNTHKTHGTRRSKLEIWLEKKLTSLYPNLQIHFNKTDTINAELDIYIPSLKLAFELNGIFHYEPIYSQLKLEQTQNNDKRKFQACVEKGIEFCSIDTSSQKYFKEDSSIKFLDIITKIITTKLG